MSGPEILSKLERKTAQWSRVNEGCTNGLVGEGNKQFKKKTCT